LIEMVVYILCRNSLDAVLLTPEPQRDVTVRTRSTQTSVGVFISDTGPGIDARVLAHLFEPFVTSKPYGVGIGLALCRSTIESLGGRIWLEAQSGEGTTFAFQLPCEPANIPK
jgi:two-component system sensor kinase FixL